MKPGREASVISWVNDPLALVGDGPKIPGCFQHPNSSRPSRSRKRLGGIAQIPGDTLVCPVFRG